MIYLDKRGRDNLPTLRIKSEWSEEKETVLYMSVTSWTGEKENNVFVGLGIEDLRSLAVAVDAALKENEVGD